ncbi:hypothetical protein B0H14DRAFT_3421985 [Mycena olivaceomarginata]|nr:hypothetical protein B0H14DRAFT_3421985 [Mycena olivaceomarginata]
MSQTVPPVLDDISDTIRTNFVGFASFTILVWDHVITFSDEVEYIWKGKKGPIIYLFIFNRYFTPLGFIINLYAYLSPSWTVERFVIYIPAPHQYPEVSNLPDVRASFAMRDARINALYPRQKWITALLGVLLIVETGINAWLISRGEPVLHNKNSGVHACSMVFDPAISRAASASAWYPLLYDSIVFALTVNRTLPSVRRKQAGFIVKRLLEDGGTLLQVSPYPHLDVIYLSNALRSVIFAITFVLTFMIVAAPPGTKNICAQMEQLITVAMMSRITLSLKRAGRRGEIIPTPFLDGRNPRLLLRHLYAVRCSGLGPARPATTTAYGCAQAPGSVVFIWPEPHPIRRPAFALTLVHVGAVCVPERESLFAPASPED